MLLPEIPKVVKKIENHSKKVYKEAELIKEKIEKGLFIDEAPNRKYIEGYSIDKNGAMFFDDIIYAEEINCGFVIFISIADVAETIGIGTNLDYEALKRPFGIYSQHKSYRPLPENISEILSLNNEEKRRTITTKIELDKDYKVKSSEYFESITKNKKAFSYETFNDAFLDPDNEYNEEINIFFKIAKGLYKNRLNKGANKDYKDDIFIKIDKIEKDKNINIGQFIINEFMLLKNINSSIISYKEKLNSIYKVYKPEFKGKYLMSNNSGRAFYSYVPGYHYGLSENFYGRWTSPIVGYDSLYNQRIEKAYIRKEKSPYNINYSRKVAIHLNSSQEAILNITEKHNKIINEKKINRLIKKLKETNYSTINSLTHDTFEFLIKYLTKNNEFIENNTIYEEIIYRIENNIISNKNIRKLASFPGNSQNAISLRDIIKNKD